MDITILHSELVEMSRGLIESMGVVIDGDIMGVEIDGYNVKIISDHYECIKQNPNFSCYPYIVGTKDSTEFYTCNLTNWTDVKAWYQGLTVVVPKITVYSKLDFIFLFMDEWNNIKLAAQTDSQVSLIYDSFTLADFICTADQRTIQSLTVLKDKGLITEEKLAQIIG